MNGVFFAFAIGAIVGLILAQVDLLLLNLARRLVRGALPPQSPDGRDSYDDSHSQRASAS